MKLRPYNWLIIGPWLRKRARYDGARIAEGLYIRGHRPQDIMNHAIGEVATHTTNRNDADLHEALGILHRAHELHELEDSP